MTCRAQTLPLLTLVLLLAAAPATARQQAGQPEDRVDPMPRQEAVVPDGNAAAGAVSGVRPGDGEPVMGTADRPLPGRVQDNPGQGGGTAPGRPAAMSPGEPAVEAPGAIGRGRAYAEDLKDYTVHLSDTESFGKVSRLIINLESGLLEQVEVTTGGGLLGIGETRFRIPFDQVAAIDTTAREMRVAISRQQIELPGSTADQGTNGQ